MTPAPPIDYTNKDFQSLRSAMLALAQYRMPEWTDRSPVDLGVLLVDLFAYMGDVVLYYQDRIANESFLPTAVERRSVLQSLRLIGYALAPPIAASAGLSLFFKRPAAGASTVVTVPSGAQFASAGSPPQNFAYLGPDLAIDLASDQVAPSPDGKFVVFAGLPISASTAQPTTSIGSSNGQPNQSFAIPSSPVVPESLVVEVNEGAGWVSWTRVDSLLYETASDGRVTLSSAGDRDYVVQLDENDVSWVGFGDGTYGRIPPTGVNNIRATWRIGGGAAGNVGPGTIVTVKTTLPLLDHVTNPAAAAGGVDHESIDHAKQFGPLAFRSGGRAVTLGDYMGLAQQVGGVAKVSATAPTWNTIQLHVAPSGPVASPVPDTLRERLLAFFEDKRMAGTFVEVLDPTYVKIDVALELVLDRRYRPEQVTASASAAVNALLAFNNVDFGKHIYLSDIYGAVENLPGIVAMTVLRFRRQDSPAAAISDSRLAAAAALLADPATPSLDIAALLRRAVQIDLAPDGRIVIDPSEIPVPGVVAITLVQDGT